MLGVGIIAPLLPLYADNLGATGIWLGVIFAGFSVSRAIVMPIFGRLSDRSGRKLFICIGLLSYAIISLGFIWANSLLQLALIRFLHGIAAGSSYMYCNVWVRIMQSKVFCGIWSAQVRSATIVALGLSSVRCNTSLPVTRPPPNIRVYVSSPISRTCPRISRAWLDRNRSI